MKKVLLIILIVLVVVGIYLNRSYAYIYYKIDKADLKSTDINKTYLINNDMASNVGSLVYVAMGDSLTAGVGTYNYEQSYPYLVAQKMAAPGNQVTLKDRSFPGFETGNLENQILPQVISDNPNIVTLLIGVNDIHNNISEEKFRKNYDNILEVLTKQSGAKIYAINIPFIGADSLMLPPYNYYFDFKTKEFNKIIKDLAESYNVGYIDLYSPTADEFKKPGSHYSIDLFHPSAQGYATWAQIIYDNINK